VSGEKSAHGKAVLSLLHLLVSTEALRGVKIKNSFEKSIYDVMQYIYSFIDMCDVTQATGRFKLRND
jgi:hypothetical protein